MMKSILKIEQLENLLKTGIYKITCLGNSKIYIGSACGQANHDSRKCGFYRRWLEHLRALDGNKHRNHYLQNSYNKYGRDNFTFEIVEYCSKEEAFEKELNWMKFYDSTNNEKGFNIIKNNFVNYGKFTEEHKKRISESLKGKSRDLEHVKKWSNKVIQLDEDNNIVGEYYSMSEAERQTGIMRQDIGQACIGRKIKRAGGFFWKKVEDIV